MSHCSPSQLFPQPQPAFPPACGWLGAPSRQVQPRRHTLSSTLWLQGFRPFLFRLPALFLPRTKYINQIHLINHIPFPLFAKDFADPPV